MHLTDHFFEIYAFTDESFEAYDIFSLFAATLYAVQNVHI